jgi:hypothetical protein
MSRVFPGATESGAQHRSPVSVVEGIGRWMLVSTGRRDAIALAHRMITEVADRRGDVVDVRLLERLDGASRS